jgi:NADH dehydrogenase [ubiquinone] 1 alpha subcomplex assembly factor 1
MPLRVVAPLIAALSLVAAAPAAPPASDALFDFEAGDAVPWQVVNDGVMGGRSRGYVEIGEGVLEFTGTLVTRGGGFTSVRFDRSFDLDEYDGLELRVRGGGRTFEIDIADGTRRWGRNVSRRAPFPTREEWTVVRVPFSALRASIFGQRVSAPPVDLSNVRRISLFILDGIDGPFRLEVDSIRAYRADSRWAGGSPEVRGLS